LAHRAGLGVDASGEPVIDPTKNVIALTEAANKRQDDLRRLTRELYDRDIAHLKEIVGLHSHYQDRVSQAEQGRIDSIRQVDREEVKQMRLEAQSAIKALADTTLTMADTLRNQNQATATTLAKSQQDQWSEMNKRLSALELGSSEGRGQKTVETPLIAELVQEVKALRGTSSQGSKNMVGYISIGLSILLGLLLLADRVSK
jgi:hypothetical protein